MLLFEKKDFEGAAGLVLDWKVECDALSDEVITEVAKIVARRLPFFRGVLGIPRGGERIAMAMSEYIDPNALRMLVCDDVWTTGTTYNTFVHEKQLRYGSYFGFVLFSRVSHLPADVYAMWKYGLAGGMK